MTHDAIKKEVQIGDCRLILGDCLEVMPITKPSLGFDGLVTDPPYGINRSKSGHDVIKTFGGILGDDRPFDPSPLFGLGTFQVLWGANHYCSRLPSDGGQWLMWLKHDPVMFTKRSTAPYELAWTNLPGSDRAFKLIWDGSIKQGVGAGKKHVHPTEKPVELMEWCLKKIPNEKRGVLDPFMGSGTTGVACVKLGRKFTGIELDEDYFNIAVERIRKAYAQPDMFVPAPEKPVQEGFDLG